jgi:serine/threonine-protein phosphatase 6 regulatory ankyrin repeat subunit B
VRAGNARADDVQAPGGEWGLTPLLKAIDRAGGPFQEDSDLAIVRILIAAGADVSRAHKGETPLCKAIGSRRAEDLVVLLLRAGADPNGPCGWDTPLGRAVLYRSVDVAAMLLEAGATPPSVAGKINEDPVLHKAAIYGPARMVTLLVRHGAPVDERSYDEGTPLMRATNVAVARALVAAGADVHARNRSGRSALTVHVQAGHDAIAAFLRSRGARDGVALASGPSTP